MNKGQVAPGNAEPVQKDAALRREFMDHMAGKLDELDAHLSRIEPRAHHDDRDAEAYAAYERQFASLRQRRNDIEQSIARALADPDDAIDWATLKTEMEETWRDILNETEAAGKDVANGGLGQ